MTTTETKTHKSYPVLVTTELPEENSVQADWQKHFRTKTALRALPKEALVMLVIHMVKDWRTLNEIHNQRARGNSWCGEYEERQRMHNGKFSVLRLVGRTGYVDGHRESGL